MSNIIIEYLRIGISTVAIILTVLGVWAAIEVNYTKKGRAAFVAMHRRQPRGMVWSTGLVTVLIILAYVAYPYKGV